MSASEIPHMTYRQYRTARRLVRECCNYDCGNCLLLDDGEECVCPQSITCSLICKWFRAAVLPLDTGLCAALFPPPFRQTATLPGVREDICPAQAQHPVLLHLCRRTCQTEQASMGQEKPGRCVEKVPSENAVISGLSRPPSTGAWYISFPPPKTGL